MKIATEDPPKGYGLNGEWKAFSQRAVELSIAGRRVEVLWLMGLGKTNLEIGEYWQKRAELAEFHRSKLFRKLQVDNMYDALRRGVKLEALPEIGLMEGWSIVEPLSEWEKRLLGEIGSCRTYQQIMEDHNLNHHALTKQLVEVRWKLGIQCQELEEGAQVLRRKSSDFKAFVTALRTGQLDPIRK